MGTLKIAIADTLEETPNYRYALGQLGAAFVNTFDPAAALACDGLLLPGGGDVSPDRYGQAECGSLGIDKELDRRQLSLLAGFVRAHKPVLGICRGAQVINVYFGGTLIQDLSAYFRQAGLAGAEHRHLEGKDAYHPVTAGPGSFLYPLYGAAFVTNSAHHQAAGALGKGLAVQARAADGTIEALCHTALPVYGVQFHPERICFAKRVPSAIDGSLVLRLFLEKIQK